MAIIGAGPLGRWLALAAARGGFRVLLEDVMPYNLHHAQEYLRQTYRTLVREWGVRFIKLDFMDSTAIEGFMYRPHTTALEALRIGLQVIRDAVGEDVILDKDGSPMLTPVGLVDTGRISADTAHSFEGTRTAAPGTRESPPVRRTPSTSR